MARNTDLQGMQPRRHALDVLSGDASRPSPDRLKSRALEAASLVGRGRGLPPDASEVLSLAAGAANLLRLSLPDLVAGPDGMVPDWPTFAEIAGRLADAAEKIDHLEAFRPLADAAVLDMARWGLARRQAAA